jgi:ribosomal-protein-alanine N-acetyltransferase
MNVWFRRPRVFLDDVRPDEAETLADIHRDAFARTWSDADFAALLSERAVFAIGVRRQTLFGNRRLAGFVLIRVAADEAEVLTIAVRAGDRGRGYGRMLMEEALRRLYRERTATCFLEVDRQNRAAVGLYRSLGFVVAGERQRYYSEPETGDGTALVMRLQVR